MNNLIPIFYHEQRILSTQQIAEAYGTDPVKIKQNFNNNKMYYAEGKHFYCLRGAELQAFKSEVENFYLAPNVNTFYLWTEKGAFLHAKSLNTDLAWQAYEILVDEYYRLKDTQQPQLESNLARAIQLFNTSYETLYPDTRDAAFQYLWKQLTGAELKRVTLVPVSYPPYNQPAPTNPLKIEEKKLSEPTYSPWINGKVPVAPIKPVPQKALPVATNAVADNAMELIKAFVKKHSRSFDPRYGIRTQDYIMIRNSVFNEIINGICPRQALLRNLADRGMIKSAPYYGNDGYKRYAFRRYDRYLEKPSYYIAIKAQILK